jgi:uncharacterized protein with PIN domain
MTNTEKALLIIKDIEANHLPQIKEGLERGYIDQNQIRVIHYHAVRARDLMEADGQKISICPQCLSKTIQHRSSAEYCEQCGRPCFEWFFYFVHSSTEYCEQCGWPEKTRA